MIAENVKKVFNENVWYIATFGDEANVVPVGFKCITDDGEFAIGAVLLETTLKNIEANGKIAIAACDGTTMESYQVKGNAKLVTEGATYDFFVKLANDTFKGAMPLKCAIVVKPEKIIVASPNKQNKEELPF